MFIYCYYIFYCRIFCVRGKIFLREFHIRVSVATWDHDRHEYSSSLCRLFLTMDETQSPFNPFALEPPVTARADPGPFYPL